jgi:hypothetical protein
MAGFMLTGASFTFGSTTYQCIENTDNEGSINLEEVVCSGASGAAVEYISGHKSHMHNYDIKVDAQDDTTLAALVEGATEATFEDHPEGDSTGNLEMVYASGGIIERVRRSGSSTSHYVLSLTIRGLGAQTIQAAV